VHSTHILLAELSQGHKKAVGAVDMFMAALFRTFVYLELSHCHMVSHVFHYIKSHVWSVSMVSSPTPD
jgi:hypothetical protein